MTTQPLKTIRYNRADRDFEASLDGEYIGSFASYTEAETALDTLASAQISPIDAAVEGALERLSDEHQRSAERAEVAEERTFFRRWAGAFRKALLYYRQGLRPEPLSSGAWLVASATRGGVVHQVGKDNHCTCEARDRGCWHAALCLGIEVAHDDMARFDGASEEIVDSRQPIADSADDDDLSAIGYRLSAMPVGGYLRSAVLDTMLERSATAIASMRTPAELGRALSLARAALISDELYGAKAA